MIRPLTCICLLLAGGSGLYLYQSKHRAQMLDREIERTLKAADAARDRIGVLRGEWALLNEPERLAALSQSHLGLKSLAPSQFVTAAELGLRLPPPAPPGTIYTPDDPEPAVQAVDAMPTPPVPVAPPASSAQPTSTEPASNQPTSNQPGQARAVLMAMRPPTAASFRPPSQVASIQQPQAAPLPPPQPVSAHPVLAPVVNVSTTTASTAKPALPRPTPVPSAITAPRAAPSQPAAVAPAGLSIGESVARMARLRGGTQAGAAAATMPQPASNPPSSSPAGASALGGVRPLLPPPVPFGSAAAIASAH